MKRNDQMGTVPCPFPGCKVVCRLFKYTPRADGRRSAFTGKWYAECSDHGRIDGASGKATQDYLLDKGTVWGAEKPEPETGTKPENSGEKPELKPAAALPPKPEKPALNPVPKPEPAKATQQPNQQPKPESTGWGFFT